MNVFLPFLRPENNYFLEIEKWFEGVFIFDTYDKIESHGNIDIINIHWPEAIFHFKEPSLDEFVRFKNEVRRWKEMGFKIVYTRHNFNPHYQNSERYKDLYDFIRESVDGSIHLGKYSLETYREELKERQHELCVIRHPLFLSTPNSTDRLTAKQVLGIKQEKRVFLVFGELRSQEEKDLILFIASVLKPYGIDVFISKYRIYSPRRYGVFRSLINMVRDIFSILVKSNIKVNNIFGSRIPESEIQYFMNSADAVIIPRIRSLNSGVLFLAHTFNKRVLAPKTGNITEELLADDVGYLSEDKESIRAAVIKMVDSTKETSTYNDSLRNNHPKDIAVKYRAFFHKILYG